MVNKFKLLFGKNESNGDRENNGDPSRIQHSDFLTEPGQIFSLLTEIEQNSPLCTIHVDGCPQEYSSSIMGIKAENNLIILDELTPKDGNAELQISKSLKLSKFHKGIHLSFNLTDLEIGYSRGTVNYKAEIPDRIFYPQRKCSPHINNRKSTQVWFGMFNKFKKLFSKGETDQPEQNDDDLSLFQNPNFLTDTDKIVTLLSEIEQSSPLCTVHVDGSPQEYSSSILGIKADKNLIILDELSPKEGNTELQNSKALKLSLFHKGIHLSFNLTDLKMGHSRGITYYKADLPDRIFYPQRRRSPRIEISSINIPFSGVSERTGLSVNGYLFDLSRGGAGVDLSVNRARIQRGDKIKNCQISFDDYVMDFEFSVRFFKSTPSSTTKFQIGGLFENLSSKSHAKLSYFITSLERIEIRKQKAV